MAIDTFINLIKTISALAGAGFGVIALLKENKNRSGKITKWGKIALIGVFCSTLLALVLQSLESAKATKDAIEAKDKSEKTTKLLLKIIDTSNTTLNQQRINIQKTSLVAQSLNTAYLQLLATTERTKKLSHDMNKSLMSQHQLMQEELEARKQILKPSFPLEPMTMGFAKEYDMKNFCFLTYLARIKSEAMIIIKRNSGDSELRVTLDKNSTLLPNPDEPAYSYLMSDSTVFTFVSDTATKKYKTIPKHIYKFNKSTKADNDIEDRLNDDKRVIKIQTSASLKEPITTNKKNGQNEITIVLNFETGTIYKIIRTRKIIATGFGPAVSSIDLLGTYMSWKSFPEDDVEDIVRHPNKFMIKTVNPTWHLLGFDMELGYESKSNNYQSHSIQIYQNQTSVQIDAFDLGLKGILPDK